MPQAAAVTTRVVRAAYGVALLAAPRAAASRLRVDERPVARVLVRILGARQVVQAALLPARSGVGLAIDAVHAASMIAVALRYPSARRPAIESAAFSGAMVLAAHWPRHEGQVVSRDRARP